MGFFSYFTNAAGAPESAAPAPEPEVGLPPTPPPEPFPRYKGRWAPCPHGEQEFRALLDADEHDIRKALAALQSKQKRAERASKPKKRVGSPPLDSHRVWWDDPKWDEAVMKRNIDSSYDLVRRHRPYPHPYGPTFQREWDIVQVRAAVAPFGLGFAPGRGSPSPRKAGAADYQVPSRQNPGENVGGRCGRSTVALETTSRSGIVSSTGTSWATDDNTSDAQIPVFTRDAGAIVVHSGRLPGTGLDWDLDDSICLGGASTPEANVTKRQPEHPANKYPGRRLTSQL